MTKQPERFTSAQRCRIQSRLLAWFRVNRRDLPWRHDRDPYRIWVSEVMLQQTTVKAVVPLFNQFLLRFPTVQKLAQAAEQDVLHAWQGLGYYRRARWLHQAAQLIVNDRNGEIPTTDEAWDALPGIGRYTRNAILSQAFNERRPIVEANSLRVLSRWLASRYDPKSSLGQAWLWSTAETLMPSDDCGDWNQALMELGALVCTVNDPKCEVCPVRQDCHAQKQHMQRELPVLSKRTEKIQEHEVGLLICNQGAVLIVQLPGSARRWGTMWTIPTLTTKPGEARESAATFASGLGLKRPELLPQDTISYVVTRHRITLTVYALQANTRQIDTSGWLDHRWITTGDAANYPMSTHQRRLFN